MVNQLINYMASFRDRVAFSVTELSEWSGWSVDDIHKALVADNRVTNIGTWYYVKL